MIVRRATADDLPRLSEMRRSLWPDEDPDALDGDLPRMLADEAYVVLVAQAAGRLIGFAEVGVRPYAEGCPGPAGYLEGIWVEPAGRRRGVARALLQAGESWARGRGLTHFASDALLDNRISHFWHAAAGFAEAERLVAFSKTLD